MDLSSLVSLALRAVALAIGVACVVLTVLKTTTTDTVVALLSIGLAALAIASFMGAR